MLAEGFNSDEYNDENILNWQKQNYIKKIYSTAKSAAYADLTTPQEGKEFEGSLGKYEFSNDVITRLENERAKLGINKIIDKQLGVPVELTLPTMENNN